MLVSPNLLLGTAKSITELWKSSSLLSSKHFDVIQEKVDSFIAPADIGRLPMKISYGFSGFTAKQYYCRMYIPGVKF